MKSILIQLLADIVTRVLAKLDEKSAKDAIDGILDRLETAVVKSSTKLDDMAILPILKKVRELLAIPDDDDNTTSA